MAQIEEKQTVEMTAEEKAQFEAFRKEKAKKEAQEKAKAERETYRQMVDDEVNSAITAGDTDRAARSSVGLWVDDFQQSTHGEFLRKVAFSQFPGISPHLVQFGTVLFQSFKFGESSLHLSGKAGNAKSVGFDQVEYPASVIDQDRLSRRQRIKKLIGAVGFQDG